MPTTEHANASPFALGEPSSFAGLALVPLFNAHEHRLEYIGLDEAAAFGLQITEVDDAGSVNTLFVDNPLSTNVLLFEGEELVGAKQNRILERTMLVRAQSKRPIPVNCVERGRWAYRSERFSPAPRTAHPTARYSSRVGGQNAVWSEIAAKSARLDACSPTEAAEEMYLKRGASLEEYLDNLPRHDGQCGAIVCLAGRVV